MPSKKQAVLSVISSIGLVGSVLGKFNQEQVNSLVKDGELITDASIAFFTVLQLAVPRFTYGIALLIPALKPLVEKLPSIIKPYFESEKK